MLLSLFAKMSQPQEPVLHEATEGGHRKTLTEASESLIPYSVSKLSGKRQLLSEGCSEKERNLATLIQLLGYPVSLHCWHFPH